MKTRTLSFFLILIAPGWYSSSLAGPQPPLETLKRATALVLVNSPDRSSSGSAFCIDKSGLFVTNAHVVEGAQDGAEIRLVVDIGRKEQRNIKAKVERADSDLDLALLKVEPDERFVALELGRDEDLKETMDVITAGFPFGKGFALEKYPEVTVLTSRITSLRRMDGQLALVQFDNQLNPGNSGGPVVDQQGHVVAVAVATIRGAAINLGIAVGQLVVFLKSPGLLFEPPALVYKDRSKPVTWTIKVRPATPKAKLPDGLSVSVTIADDVGSPRRMIAKSVGEGLFRVTVVPVPRDPDREVNLIANFGNQVAGVRVKDRDVKVGGRSFMLSDLSQLFSNPPRALTARLGWVNGAIVGLGKVKVKDRKGKTVSVDLDRATSITVRPADPPPPVRRVQVVVELKREDKVLVTARRTVEFPGGPVVIVRFGPNMGAIAVGPAPPLTNEVPFLDNEKLLEVEGTLKVDGIPCGSGGSIAVPKVAIGAAHVDPGTSPAHEPSDAAAEQPKEGEPLVVKVDGTIHDVTLCGGGRYLLLSIKDRGHLAVFDVNKAEVVKDIPLPSENVLVAAGAEKILLIFPAQKLVQRWDLATMVREVDNAQLPIQGRVHQVAMGSDSRGPLLAWWSVENSTNAGLAFWFSLIDPISLKVLRYKSYSQEGALPRRSDLNPRAAFSLFQLREGSDVHLRAAAGGSAFGFWSANRSPSGIGLIHLNAGDVRVLYQHDQAQYLAFSADGRTVYSAPGMIRGSDGKALRTELAATASSTAYVPASSSEYYLSISGFGMPSGPSTATIHVASSGSRLLTVSGLNEMASLPLRTERMIDEMTIEKRYCLIPAAQLLVTVPTSNDRLVLRRLDADEPLMRSHYLSVTSPTTIMANPGKALHHRITVRTKSGDLSFTVTRGPKDMLISKQGELSWNVPNGAAGETFEVVLTIADGSGHETFHTVWIKVQ